MSSSKLSDDLTQKQAKVAANAYRGEAVTHRTNIGETPTEKWLEELNTPLVQIWFRGKDGTLFDERHVNDPETLEETILMSLKRLGGQSVAMPYHGRWCVFTPGERVRGVKSSKYRYYDTREAAEMILIHNA